MNENITSPGKRLETCASFVRRGTVAADIGTDHAYLPIWLIQNGICPKVYASDINDEPIRSAKRNIECLELCDKIITFTGDGLQKIPQSDLGDIIIAGMGGDNIVSIINKADWLRNRKYRLIMQPMSHTERLREYLYSHGYQIIAEKAICESGRLYTIICAEYSDEKIQFTDFDIFAGKLDSNDPCAAALLKKQAGIIRSMAEGAAAKGNAQDAARYSSLAEKIIRYAEEKTK